MYKCEMGPGRSELATKKFSHSIVFHFKWKSNVKLSHNLSHMAHEPIQSQPILHLPGPEQAKQVALLTPYMEELSQANAEMLESMGGFRVVSR